MTIVEDERGDTFPFIMADGMRLMVIVTDQGFFKLSGRETASRFLEP